MSAKNKWLWAALAGGALAITGCRESQPEDTQDETLQQEQAGPMDEDRRDLSGGPEEGTGGAGDQGEVLGGEQPQQGEGSEAQQELSGQEQQKDAPEGEN